MPPTLRTLASLDIAFQTLFSNRSKLSSMRPKEIEIDVICPDTTNLEAQLGFSVKPKILTK